MTKLAMYYVDQSFEALNLKYSSDFDSAHYGRLIAVIHDELITYIPGQGKLIDVIYSDDNTSCTPIWEFPPLSHEYAQAQENGMKKAMDDLLHPLIPGFPSKADCNLGSSWAAK